MLTREEVVAFCSRCDWAHECWQLRKFLFDENADLALLQAPRNAHFFHRILEITQEYWMQQVAKLHDPAEQMKRNNLTLAYVCERGPWSAQTQTSLQDLKGQLDKFYELIKPARNRLLAHNDRNSIVGTTRLGDFQKGIDTHYFSDLQRFADIVHSEIVGRPFRFDELVRNDVEVFMHTYRVGGA